MMPRKLQALLAASLLLLTSRAFSQKDPNVLKFPDLEFKPEKPGYARIQPGVDFYFKENHEQPSLNVMIFLKSGSLADPKNKEGLASLTLQLMKSGGTKDFSPENVEDRLDFLGSTLSAVVGGEYSEFDLWTLSKNFDASWELLADLLLHPAFDKERLETEKNKELESIRRRWDYPLNVGWYLFNDLVYGKDYPDIRRTTSSGIESVTREDVQAFYENNILGRELIIAFAGDFTATKMTDVLKTTFKNWPGKPAVKSVFPKAKLAAKPGLYLIDRPDLTQATIYLGHLGINRFDPDNVEINIMNSIYGGDRSGSRLLREVTSNRGLAYFTYGQVEGGRDRGLFFTWCQTKTSSAAEVIMLIRDIASDMTVNPVIPVELETAKKFEQNAFVHKFDSPESILLQEISLKVMGYPENYLTTYIPKIKRVDAAKVLSMAKRTIHPNEMIILVVGKKNELIDQLKGLKMGDITELRLPKE